MNREMTEDTRRAIAIIQPLLDSLGVEAEADDSVLYMDGQAIGIGCNSTYATVMEAIGWIFWERYSKKFRPVDIAKGEVDDTIKRFWISKAVLKKIRNAEREVEAGNA